MNTNVSLDNLISDKYLREEMKALILAEYDDKSFRLGDLLAKYRNALKGKNIEAPEMRKLNNLFYSVKTDLVNDGLLISVKRGTYYCNSAGVNEGIDEMEEEFVSEVEDGPIIDDKEPDLALTTVVGNGASDVYVFYYPCYRELAELKGEKTYRCKIGLTYKGIPRRFSRQYCTDAPERRYIAVRIRTDYPQEVEKYIHSALKAAGRQCTGVYGREWFMTSPEEVLALYASMSGVLNGSKGDSIDELMCTTI